MESSSNSEDEYGQMERPTLLGYLKQILEQYPNTSVLKEMLQNAEDAKATEFKAMIFNEAVQAKQCSDNKYFEPPGLIIYNDAVFSERDWKGISSISNSFKREDASTVGKFGLGFKSVFHLADYAVIISGDRIMIIDPFQPEERVIHKLSLKKISAKKWFCSFQKLTKGFSVFGFSESNLKNNFSGTLFWFPLRLKSSALCNEVFSSRNMEQLLESFAEEAEMNLLFLLSVKQIQLISFDTDKPIYEACTERKTCVYSSLSATEYNYHLKSIDSKFPKDSLSCTSVVECFKCFKGQTHVDKWFVNHYYLGTNSCTNSQLFTLSKELKYGPCGGVAAPLSTNVLNGHTFCFLPLPFKSVNKTGLPVHVNGFFALSPDRDHVKWAEENNEILEHSQLWNTALIEEVILKAYVEVILALCKNNEDSVFVYNLIPVENENTTWNWRKFISKLNKKLFQERIFYTKNNGGSWLCKNQAIFNIFLDDRVTNELGKQLEQSIETAISYYDVNFVVLPDKIKTLLYSLDSGIHCITREYFVSMLKAKEMKENGYKSLSPCIKEDLLYYLLLKNNLHILSGLCLLPLISGQYVALTPRNTCQEKDMIWLCSENEMTLFPVKDNFVGFLPCPIFDILKQLLDGNWNVNHLKPRDVCQVLRSSIRKCVIKENDANGREYYTPEKHVVLTKEWLGNVWSYLSKNNIIDKCTDIPLLPLNLNNTCFQSNDIKKLVSFHDNIVFDLSDHLSKTFVSCLEKFSIFVLKTIPEQITNYVLKKNAKKIEKSVLKLIEDIHSYNYCADIVVKFNSTTDEEKKEFGCFLAKNCDLIPSSMVNFFQLLEIFPSGMTPMQLTSKLSSISCVKAYITFSYFPVPLPHEMLLLWGLDYQDLAEKLGAKHYTLKTVMLKTLTSLKQQQQKYSKKEIIIFFNFFMENISKWDDKCLTLAQNFQFLEARNGEQKKPSELFVSTPTLQLLFTYHPSKIVKDGYKENVLAKLGVKREGNLCKDDLLPIARYISDNHDNQELYHTFSNISRCLLDIIEKLFLSHKLSTGYLQKVVDMKFLAHQHSKPTEYPQSLPWKGTEQYFSSPREVKSLQLTSILGSVCFLVDDISCPHLSKNYQWINAINPEIIIHQILEIKMNWRSECRSELWVTLKKIYKHIFDKTGFDLDCYKTDFEDLKLLFNGTAFFSPSNILLSSKEKNQFNLEPYIGVLTDELSKYNNFFKQLGCIEKLSVEKCIIVIKEIDFYHKKGKNISEDQIKKDRSSVIKLLQHILIIRSKENLENVLVPIGEEKLTLKPANKCTVYPLCERRFCLTEEERSHFAFVHDDVPEQVCKGLNIPTLTQRFVLHNNATELISDFGQQEKLTTRLSNILEGYKDGVAVFKEMVQNADDAGATEIMFMYDERKNQDSRKMLLSPRMAECQGPALWSSNNAQFSNSDFINITNLAGKTKLADNSKIGKFGLGFCAVYNITDVPSILSGNTLVIFDPHTSHLGQAIKDPSSPGIRITLDNKLCTRFSDQFKPYHEIFKCDMLSEVPLFYNGTMFRLPLRTQKQCEESKIKKKEYNHSEMKKLIQMFLSMAGNILLFTQNIQKIQVFHLLEGHAPNEAKEIFSATKTKKVQSVEPPIIQQTASIVKKLSLGQIPGDVHWIEHISLFLRTSSPFDKNDQVIKSTTDWLISWYVETKNMMKLVTKFCAERRKALPLGSVAILIENGKAKALNDHMPLGLYKKGHIFCFLPLPGEYNIPVHINGCFEVNNERTSIVGRTGEEMETVQNDWNVSLLKYSVCKAYTYAVVDMAQKNYHHENNFEIWPKNKAENTLFELLKAFYGAILLEDLPVFIQNNNYLFAYKFSECAFLTPDLCHQPGIGDKAFKIFQIFGKPLGIPIELPLDVYNCLENSKDFQKFSKQIVNMDQFFIKVFFPNIQGVEKDTRDALVLFALKLGRTTVFDSLKNYPCIPMLPKDFLRKPCEIILKHNTIVTDLFTEQDERFPHQKFSAYEIIPILKNLGATYDELPIDLVIERANSVRFLPYKQGCQRSAHIIKYLMCIKSRDKDLYKALQNIPFISVMNCPDNWLLRWPVGSYNAFEKPTEVFNYNCLNLCGCSHSILNYKNYCTTNVFKNLHLKDLEDISLSEILLQIDSIDELSDTQLKPNQFDIVSNITKDILKFFSNYCISKEISLKEELKHKRFICVENQVFCPDNLTFEEIPFNCFPFLISLKFKYALANSVLKQGLVFVGVSETITLDQIKEGLSKFSQKNTLKKQEVEIYINLVRLCHQKFPDKTDWICFLPDILGQLQPCCNLSYLDTTGLENKFENELIHESFPVQICKHFKIPSYSQTKLMKISSFMSFGQKEDLVDRLKNLIKEYRFDKTLFNELIQNAEDAGATEVHFVLDKRQHSTNGIFDERWKAVQGPALCAFNDSCFSEKDLIGIQNLGTGSKANDSTKIGQFGLGFNVVYNITDVPSFLTIGDSVPNGSTFCVFDPLCSYCVCEQDNRPGIRIPDVNILKSEYPGVYEGYLQGENELPHPQGTWFRFPLRTKSMTKISRLKKEEIQVEKIEKMFKEMEKEACLYLLFLKSVRKITFSCKNANTDLQTIAECKSSIYCNQSDVKEYHVKSLDNEPKHSKSLEICYQLETEGQEKQLWLISSVLGSLNESNLPPELGNHISNGDIQLPLDCSVAVLLKPKPTAVKGKLFCSLPLPLETNLPVHVNGRFSLTSNRLSLFQDIEGQSTPDGLWNDFLLQNQVAKAYLNVIQFIKLNFSENEQQQNRFYYSIFPDLSTVCNDFAQIAAKGLFKIFFKLESCIWPLEKEGNIQWVSMNGKCKFTKMFADNTDEHYKKLVESEIELISRKKLRPCEKMSKISDLQIKAKNQAKCLRHQLKVMNFKLVLVPHKLFESINKSLEGNFSIEFVSPKIIYNFLRLFPNIPFQQKGIPIQKTCFQNIDNLCIVFSYIITEIKTIDDLNGLPLCLTQDKNVCIFGTKTCLASSFHSLLPGSKEKFLHESIIKILPYNLILGSFVQKFDITHFKMELSQSFDVDQMRGNQVVEYVPSKNMPDFQWYEQFWKFMSSCETSSINFLIQELSNWRLLTGHTETKRFLVPLLQGNYLFDTVNSKGILFSSIKEIFIRIDLPFKHHYIPANLVAQYDNQKSFLDFMIFHMEKMNKLNKDMCQNFLKYFEEYFFSKSMDFEDIENVKKIPLVSVGKVSLPMNNYKKIYCIDTENLPYVDFQRLSTPSNIALLCDVSLSKDFLSIFQITKIQSNEVFYTELLQVIIERLEITDIEKHLDFLVEKEYFKIQPLKNKLKEIKLVYSNGSFLKASEFFDSSILIFETFCDKTELLPVPYNKTEWKDLFIVAGLKTTITCKKFKEFAKTVSSLNIQNQETLSKSQILFSHLKCLVDSGNWEYFLNEIENIQCIVPYKIDDIYENILPQYGCTRLVSLAESVPKKYFLLVWSSLPLLPLYAYFDFKDFEKDILKDVCSHIDRLCRSLSNCVTLTRQEVEKIMMEVYTYLNEHKSNDIKTLLLTTPLVFVPDKLIFVHPSNIAINLNPEEDMSPYLVKLPLYYGEYKDLFKCLGATENISLKQLAYIFNSIAEVSKQTDGYLQPKEKEVLSLAFEKFCTLLDIQNSEHSNELEKIEKLYLVDTKGILHKSTNMICNSHFSWTERLENELSLHIVRSSASGFKDEKRFSYLPDWLRPKLMSNVGRECIENCELSDSFCKNIEQLSQIFRSDRFLKIMETFYTSKEQWQKTSSNFINLKIVTTNKIETVLFINEEKIESSKINKSVFFDYKENEIPTLFLKSNLDSFPTWIDDNNIYLQQFLRKCFEDVRYSDSKEIISYLHCLEILEKMYLKDQSSLQKDPLLERLGDFVPKVLYSTLIQEFVSFKAGEIVALISYTGDDVSATEEENAMFVYVKIIRCTDEKKDLLFQTFVVDLGESIQEKQFVELYKFVRSVNDNKEVGLELYLDGVKQFNYANLNMLQKEVLQILCNAWKLETRERKLVIKRLRLTWHPDRKPEQKVLCNDMTVFIHDVIRRLEEGEIDELLDKLTQRDCCRNWSYSHTNKNNFGEFSSFSQNVYSQGFCNSTRGWTHENAPNPQPEEAQRYLKQAKLDYRLAEVLAGGIIQITPCTNWICYLSHQACEKAIKAYGLSVDERKVNKKSHSLEHILKATPNFILEIVSQLNDVFNNYNGLRYPDALQFPKIPAEIYQSRDIKAILSSTSVLLETIDEKLL